MLRAAVLILPVDVMASRQGSRGCCSWLCCCCCCCRKGPREKSPLLSGGEQGGKKEASEQPTAGPQVMAGPDGQSETQQLELTVQDDEEEQEEIALPTSQKDERRSRTTSLSYEPPVKDPATSTTFVRGSSGRTSWRMVPHPKRESQISVKEEGSPQPEAPADTETGVGTSEPVAMAPETPPPPAKDYTLVPSYQDNQSEPSEEGEEEVEREEEREMVHTSSFSFTARDGQLKGTQ